MRFDVVTLFPALVEHAAAFGVTGRARERGLWSLGLWNPRDYATDVHRTVDDRPYGGGPGMVMLPGPLAAAIRAAKATARAADAGYVVVAGRYEGVDERVVASEVDEEIAIGDFVVSGGELPALMLIDAVVRQLPGALNDAESATQDSFVDALLDCPHYTRPEVFEGRPVPGVLLSGNHAEIRRWRRKQALGRTWQRRPDLLALRAQSGD